ncbi:MAG: hypothetical protein MJZ84_06960 [Paludibacteraceae bacterium]|nr:hypothetical protein [Paludibacteraceae bacterium]
MIIQLKSSLHTEDLPDTIATQVAHHLQSTIHNPQNSQVIYVMTGGTENQFVQKVQLGEIDLAKPVYLVASGQSNSLAASLEILAYINQHGGKGEIVESVEFKV